jgi:hypothetical protein
VAAGIKIRSVVTPAAALCSVARLRRAAALREPQGRPEHSQEAARSGRRSAPGGIEAYVALEETATCIALVREQILVAARDLPSGYVHDREPFGERVPLEKVATRLAGELADFFSAAGIDSSLVTGVAICGALPDMRTMTVPIMEQLDIEVEALDSMFGIDAGRLPAGLTELPERAVELRLAWAAAADWKAPLNLVRDQRRRAAAAVFAQAAVVAGVGAGVTLGWGIQKTAWLEAAGPTPSAARRAPVARPQVLLPKAVGTSTIPVVRREPPAGNPPAIMREPVMVSPSLTAARPAKIQQPVEPEEDGAPRRATVPPKPGVPAAGWSHADVQLDSILFGPERRLAVIDGRIVEPGDVVEGTRVVEIATTSVTVRDRSGRLQRLLLGKKQP